MAFHATPTVRVQPTHSPSSLNEGVTLKVEPVTWVVGRSTNRTRVLEPDEDDDDAVDGFSRLPPASAERWAVPDPEADAEPVTAHIGSAIIPVLENFR